MNIKEELIKLRNGLLARGDIEEIKKQEEKEQNIPNDTIEVVKNEYTTFKKVDSMLRNLDDKVDNYINWYFNNAVKGHYTPNGEYNEPRRMRDIIEKVAVWYELRYPEYEVNRLMPGSSEERTEINDVMFNNNQYFNDTFDNSKKNVNLNWPDFYNKDVFIKSLPSDEQFMFREVHYRSNVNVDTSKPYVTRLYLTPDGIVEEAENFNCLKEDLPNTHIDLDNYFKGKHIKEVLEYFKSNNITLHPNNEIEDAIKWHDKWVFLKDEFLNCIMYRIIERGGNRIGPRRAFLFAKEFNRNIDIPMMYGVDTSDPGLKLFVDEYIKAGGSKDLVCYENYHRKSNKDEMLRTIKVGEIIDWLEPIEKRSKGRQLVNKR